MHKVGTGIISAATAVCLAAVVPASGELLNVQLVNPVVVYESTGQLTYNPQLRILFAQIPLGPDPVPIPTLPTFPNLPNLPNLPTLPRLGFNSVPLAILLDSGPVFVCAPRLFDVAIRVGPSGELLGGVLGDDLVLRGVVDEDGDGIPEFSGVLLTGEVLAFGYKDTGTTTDFYDILFEATGGSLLDLFGNNVFGVTVTSEGSTFTGSFTQPFTGGAKGDIGPLNQLPVADAVVEQLTGIGSNALVRLDGSGSSDPNDSLSSLTFNWTVDGIAVCEGPQLNCGTIETPFTFGSHEVVLRVSDPSGASNEVVKTVILDPARLAVLEIDRAKVEFSQFPTRLELRGEIGLPFGVNFTELSPQATAAVGMSPAEVLSPTPVAFTVAGIDLDEWLFADPAATSGITQFNIDWTGARFQFREQDFPIELKSQLITTSQTILTLKFRTDDIGGPFSMDIGGLATVDIDAAGVIAATVPFVVEDPAREATLTLPFPLLDTTVITISGSASKTIIVGGGLKGSVGRYSIEINFAGSLLPDRAATLPRTIDLDLTVGVQGYPGTTSLGQDDLEAKGDEWRKN